MRIRDRSLCPFIQLLSCQIPRGQFGMHYFARKLVSVTHPSGAKGLIFPLHKNRGMKWKLFHVELGTCANGTMCVCAPNIDSFPVLTGHLMHYSKEKLHLVHFQSAFGRQSQSSAERTLISAFFTPHCCVTFAIWSRSLSFNVRGVTWDDVGDVPLTPLLLSFGFFPSRMGPGTSAMIWPWKIDSYHKMVTFCHTAKYHLLPPLWTEPAHLLALTDRYFWFLLWLRNLRMIVSECLKQKPGWLLRLLVIKSGNILFTSDRD